MAKVNRAAIIFLAARFFSRAGSGFRDHAA
jgi:hypothetical protein